MNLVQMEVDCNKLPARFLEWRLSGTVVPGWFLPVPTRPVVLVEWIFLFLLVRTFKHLITNCEFFACLLWIIITYVCVHFKFLIRRVLICWCCVCAPTNVLQIDLVCFVCICVNLSDCLLAGSEASSGWFCDQFWLCLWLVLSGFIRPVLLSVLVWLFWTRAVIGSDCLRDQFWLVLRPVLAGSVWPVFVGFG